MKSDSPNPPPGTARATPVSLGRVFRFIVILMLVGLAIGFLPRWLERRALAQHTREQAATVVAVVHPGAGQTSLGLPLPAEIQPFVEAPIYARASGYLKHWDADLGSTVTNGQLLAEIDTPELDQQLAQARAFLAQSQAALDLAKLTADRWTDLLKTASVSEQETAEKKSDYELKQANLQAAQAELHRLEELKGFARITAPFDGTITVRQTDVGQLITAGSGKELFRLAQINPLRVFVRAPQTLAAHIRPGQNARLLLDPARKIEAEVVHTAGAIDPASRTLLVELRVDNTKGDILAGSYAQVQLTDGQGTAPVTVPGTALLFRAEGIRVGVVDTTGKVSLRPVKLGRDYGQSIEILEGINQADNVINNPPDGLAEGQLVQVVTPANSTPAK